MDLLKNFRTLALFISATGDQTIGTKNYNGDRVIVRTSRAAMDALKRPPFVPSAPTMKKEWSLKEQQEFYKNNPMYVMNLPVKSDTTEYEVKINADCLCDFCQECYTEDEMHYVADAAICESCFERYN